MLTAMYESGAMFTCFLMQQRKRLQASEVINDVGEGWTEPEDDDPIVEPYAVVGKNRDWEVRREDHQG